MGQPFRNFLIFVFVFKVTAYPTSQQHNNQRIRTGRSSYLPEINFHPLEDSSAPLFLQHTIQHQHQQQQHHHHHPDQSNQNEPIFPEDLPRIQDAGDEYLLYHLLSGGPDPMMLLQPPPTLQYENNNFESINYGQDKQDAPAGNVINAEWKALNRQGAPADTTRPSSETPKRNAFRANKRQKTRSTPSQPQYIPAISVGAINNLKSFFDNLQQNMDFLEKGELTEDKEQLLDGDYPMSSLRKELIENPDIRPAGTAAFLHAIRTYRPSQRIRNLVAMQPNGYHGSNFHDPNYMWVGLGK